MSKYLFIGNEEDIHNQIKPNKVLTLISITLLTLMVIFLYRMIINLIYPHAPLSNELNILIQSCLAVNIVAYLLLYKYQTLLKKLYNRVEMKTVDLRGTNKNLRIEIAERKRAELDLQKSEEKYRLIVNLIPAIVFKGYADFMVDFFDDKIEKLTGYKRQEFESKQIKWSDIIIEDDLDEVKRQFKNALKDGNKYVRDYRIRNKKGNDIWIHERAQIILDKNGTVESVIGLFFDINTLKQGEKMISQSAGII